MRNDNKLMAIALVILFSYVLVLFFCIRRYCYERRFS